MPVIVTILIIIVIIIIYWYTKCSFYKNKVIFLCMTDNFSSLSLSKLSVFLYSLMHQLQLGSMKSKHKWGNDHNTTFRNYWEDQRAFLILIRSSCHLHFLQTTLSQKSCCYCHYLSWPQSGRCLWLQCHCGKGAADLQLTSL